MSDGNSSPFLTGEQITTWIQAENLDVLAFAHPTPDRIEFTLVNVAATTGVQPLPTFAREFVLSRLANAMIERMIPTEIPGHGPATVLSAIIPPDGGVVVGMPQEGD